MTAPTIAPDDACEEFLRREQSKDLLRLVTAGSVDDGKSTLIGRLLYDSQSIYLDQLESVTKASVGRGAGTIDFSLLTDGLRAEREQNITIDVAYRYFSTTKRKFIIADTPGHEQYTRNMVTGASTAELAVILVDVRKGLLPQSRRHAAIAALLGLRHPLIAVNKMDLVGYESQPFESIEKEFRQLVLALNVQPFFIPVSALMGDNVVTRSKRMRWYQGPSLLEYLEQVPVNRNLEFGPFRFAVQRVVRPQGGFRGYAGTVSSGSIRVGDAVTVHPAGRTTTVAKLHTYDCDVDIAKAGEAITIGVVDEIDVARGDLLAGSGRQPTISRDLEATLVWLSEDPAEIGKRYRLKHMTRLAWATIRQIHHGVDVDTLQPKPISRLVTNSISKVSIRVTQHLAFDLYTENRATGAFVLFDEAINATVAAGMIVGVASPIDAGAVTLDERIRRQRHLGAIIRLPGRNELAKRLERELFEIGCTVFTFDEEVPQLCEFLLGTGAIVVTSDGPTGSWAVNTMSAPVDLSGWFLPANDDEALLVLVEVLKMKNILKIT